MPVNWVGMAMVAEHVVAGAALILGLRQIVRNGGIGKTITKVLFAAVQSIPGAAAKISEELDKVRQCCGPATGILVRFLCVFSQFPFFFLLVRRRAVP